MIESIRSQCRSYFEGFQDLSTLRKNDVYKNIFGLLKVISYFTLVLPLIAGLIYGVSSLNWARVTFTPPGNESSEAQKTNSAGRRILGQPSVDPQPEELPSSSPWQRVDEQLEQLCKPQTRDELPPDIAQELEKLFKSSKRDEKFFTIRGTKVRVVVNPSGEPLKVGRFEIEDRVVLVSDREVPEEILKQIRPKIPRGGGCDVIIDKNFGCPSEVNR